MKTCPNCGLKETHDTDKCIERIKEWNKNQNILIKSQQDELYALRGKVSDMKQVMFEVLFARADTGILARFFSEDIRD